MKYVILNDGETFTSLKGCIIYDSKTGASYTVRKDRRVYGSGDHEKGINEIYRNEYLEKTEPINDEGVR